MTRTGDPSTLLAEANRLSWLGNWHEAQPLYQKAEVHFHASGKTELEIYARIGRIRGQAANVPLDRSLLLLNDELDKPIVKINPRLRLWCLVLKGSLEIDADSTSAKRDWTEALDVATSVGEPQWAARANGELGILAFLDGNTASAVSLVGKAILSAYRSGDTASQIRLLSILGSGFNEERRFSEALMMFKRAIATAEKTPQVGFPFLAYGGEATALIGLHQIEPAEQLLDKALAKARSQDDRLHEADLMVELGEAATADHKTEDAKAYLTEAGRIAGEMRLYRTLAYAMFDLATVERQLSDAQGARLALETGLNASRRIGDRYYVPRDLTALAELKAAENNFQEADRLFEQAEDVLDGILINQHSFEESTARAGSMSTTYLEHFRLAQTHGDVARAFQVLERVRGRIVASRLYTRDKSELKSPRLVTLEGNIAATQLALLRSEDGKERTALLERLLEDERNLAFELNEVGLERHDMLAKPASLQMIKRALGKDELLVEYVLDEPNSFCIAITRESVRLLTLSAGGARIQGLAQSFLEDLKSRRSGDQPASELHAILLDPALRLFHKSRLIVSPDGILHALPFEALRSHGELVVRSEVVSYSPSATVLIGLRDAPRVKASRSLLAVGAVEYGLVRSLPATVERGSLAAALVRGLAELSGSSLRDLPGSRDEVLSIARIAGNDPKLLLGQDATEGAFKSLPLSDFRMIHLAVHAAADPQYPDRAALVLGVAQNSSDDGLLQVREIMHLPLDADLVTLSACETGLGTAEGEAGVVNLEQAFLIAGARAVVASLWNVEDNSTTLLMKSFYSHLAGHEDKATALAHAKRDMLDRYGNVAPYYWAGFVLAGDGAQEVLFGQ
jgi:CHAT domain-containing protein